MTQKKPNSICSIFITNQSKSESLLQISYATHCLDSEMYLLVLCNCTIRFVVQARFNFGNWTLNDEKNVCFILSFPSVVPYLQSQPNTKPPSCTAAFTGGISVGNKVHSQTQSQAANNPPNWSHVQPSRPVHSGYVQPQPHYNQQQSSQPSFHQSESSTPYAVNQNQYQPQQVGSCWSLSYFLDFFFFSLLRLSLLEFQLSQGNFLKSACFCLG